MKNHIYYYLLSIDKYNSIDLYNNLVKFSKNEELVIEIFLGEYKFFRNKNVNPNWKGLNSKNKSKSIQISKLDDEWIYFIYINQKSNFIRCFKCDQFEGFIKCMKDNIKYFG